MDYEIPLFDIPLRIIEKYRGVIPDGKLLPMYSNSTLNIHLKRIAEICGIERRLVFHCGRHTYATEVTLAYGVPLETLNRMLGHNRITTTQIYARVTDRKVDEDMKRMRERTSDVSVALMDESRDT